MKLLKALPILIAVTSSFSASASLIDYTSTFTDNGVITTEIRTNTSTGAVNTWEWLDLTVTNGMSFNDIAADVADGILDNNVNGTLMNIGNARADITALSTNARTGWRTVTHKSINNLLTAFFEINIPEYQRIWTNTPNSIETYINFFGDTFHEGYDDYYNSRMNNKGYTGHTHGFSSTTHVENNDINYAPIVSDGEIFWNGADYEDHIYTGNFTRGSVSQYSIGTYLQREVKVPEPSTFLIFSLALIGLTMRRHLN